jgi:hypothetical protein
MNIEKSYNQFDEQHKKHMSLDYLIKSRRKSNIESDILKL